MASDKGFSLVEVMISVGLVGTVFLGVTGVLSFYSLKLTEIRQDQDLRAAAGTLLKSFATTASCNRQIKQLLGDYPVVIQKQSQDLSTVEWEGAPVPAIGPFPQRPLARLEGAHLEFEGTPLPGQTILRARVSVDYQQLRSTPAGPTAETRLRTRTTSIFFSLDPQGRLTNCLDDRIYKRIEWSQRFCTRIEGQWRADFTCDMTRSNLVRHAGCAALGLGFAGGGCVR